MDEKRGINDPHMTKNDILFIVGVLLMATLLTLILLTTLTNAGYTEITFGGRITVDECTTPPSITNIYCIPDTQEQDGYINITANITTTCGTIDTIILYIQHPNETLLDYSMTQYDSTSIYYNNNTYTNIGEYTYFIWVNDTAGNHHQCSSDTFTITENDTTPPSITNITDTPDPQVNDSYVNITCTITENNTIDTVMVNITHPNATTTNTSMNQYGETNTYYHNDTYTNLGNYTYYIWVNDTDNNTNKTSNYTFTITEYIPPSIPLDCPHAMLIHPLNNSEIDTRDAILTVYIYDDDTFIWEINITFYDNESNIISQLTSAANWNVSTAWTNLTPGETYTWYVYLDNGTGNYTSGQWTFTVTGDIMGTATDFWGTWVLFGILILLMILSIIFKSFILTVFALVTSSVVTYTYMPELLGSGNLFDNIMFYLFFGLVLVILVDLLILIWKGKK